MKLLTLVVLLFFTTVAFAQEKPLSNDDRGKLIYYEVVELKGVSADDLRSRAASFFLKSPKFLKLKSAEKDSLIQASGKLVINKTALVLSRPSGEVRYNLYVEAKEGKYRFWLTDFIFIPYQRDRYGNFVPSTTVGTPLENKPGKLNAVEWAGYVKASTKDVNNFAAGFKEFMLDKTIIPAVIKVAPVSPSEKW